MQAHRFDPDHPDHLGELALPPPSDPNHPDYEQWAHEHANAPLAEPEPAKKPAKARGGAKKAAKAKAAK